MSSWNRFSHLERQKLLAVVVPVRREGWFTRQRMVNLNSRHDSYQRCYGRDRGGDVFVTADWHHAIEGITGINAYVLQRRALRDAFVGQDLFGEPVYVSPGETFIAIDRQVIADDHIDDLYDICISFNTEREAVLFRMMVQGVVDPEPA